MLENNLFVLGRNIYQAACGSSNAAIEFVRKFALNVAEVSGEKRKAILDGMLFEVFFDKNAELRQEIKFGVFDDLFELERFPDFSSSFEFISSALANSNGDFYCLPGRGDSLSVAIVTRLESGIYNIHGVYVGSKNIMKAEEGEDVEERPELRIYRKWSQFDLAEMLSFKLAVPLRLISMALIGFRGGGEFVTQPGRR
jgi:hypothetical protein